MSQISEFRHGIAPHPGVTLPTEKTTKCGEFSIWSLEHNNNKSMSQSYSFLGFYFVDWLFFQSHIMTAQDSDNISSQLELPHLPDMLFSINKVQLKHESGAGMEFIPIEALKLVNAHEDLVHVATAADWLAARQDSPHLNKIRHPYDWTFTTQYKGVLESHLLSYHIRVYLALMRPPMMSQ